MLRNVRRVSSFLRADEDEQTSLEQDTACSRHELLEMTRSGMSLGPSKTKI